MILKVFRNRETDCGWVYVEGIEEIQVDISTWGITRPVLKDSDDHRAYEICGVESRLSDEGEERKADRDSHPGLETNRCHLLFDPGSFVKDFKEGEIRRLKVITAYFEDGGHGSFVIEDDRSSWLLTDNGSTIERL